MKILHVLLLLLGTGVLGAIEVPFSTGMIKTETNHITGMERISPADRQQIPLATDCWLWHDGRNLYVYWELEIDDNFMPGAFATRDDIQTSDYVRFQIKTIKNENFAYYFSAFPRGTAFDAVRKEELQVDKAWNSLYDCTSEYSGKSWTVLMTIPFRDLRFDGNPPYNWAFTIARQVQSTVSSYAYPFTPVSGKTPRQYYDAFDSLVIRETIDSPRNYYFIPYFYRSYDFLTKENSFDPKHLGMNLVYRPSSNTSVKIAFNPDFTEVPTDEERDSHNDKYPPQLGENRIFFTEDLNAFGVSESQFYSRNIMQPVYAVKFTASGKNWNMGFLSARDKETESNGVVINPADDYNILAFKPQFGDFSSQLTLLSRTNSEDNAHNYVFYSAPSYQVNSGWNLRSRFALSADKNNGTDFKYGILTALSSDQKFGDLMSSATVSSITKDYVPGMASEYAKHGIDQYAANVTLNYDKYLSDSFLRTYNTYLAGDITLERAHSKEIRNYYVSGNLSLVFTPQFSVSMNTSTGADRMPSNNKLLQWRDNNFYLSLNRWQTISGNIGAAVSENNIYALANPQHSYQAKSISAGLNGFLGPVISYIFRNTHVIWTDLPRASEYVSGVQGDNEYDITNLDMELTFNNYLKLVTGVRYNNYEMYGFTQHVGYFATMHYLVNSSTKVYMGFKSTEDEFLDNMQKSSETAWLKITKTF